MVKYLVDLMIDHEAQIENSAAATGESDPKRWEVVAASGRVIGEPDQALLRSWGQRGARARVVGKQVEPGLWTSSSAGAADARTEFVSLRRVVPESPIPPAALRESEALRDLRTRELEALRDLRVLVQSLVNDGTVSMPASARRAAIALVARTGELFAATQERL